MGIIEETVDKLFKEYDKHKDIYKLVEDFIVYSDYSIRYDWQLHKWLDAIVEHKERRLEKDLAEVQASGSTWQDGKEYEKI